MKLYYSPGACSLSPHICLREAGLPFELERVDLKTGQTEHGVDFRSVNPKGYVPALVLDDGSVLTEGPAIVQYVADRAPEKELAPPAGSMARYRLMEWLNYITSELHKSFGPLFDARAPADWKALVREQLGKRFDYLSEHLGQHAYLTGDGFSVADAYLFTILGWGKWVSIDVARWPALVAYQERIAARPAVRAALSAEKLLRE